MVKNLRLPKNSWNFLPKLKTSILSSVPLNEVNQLHLSTRQALAGELLIQQEFTKAMFSPVTPTHIKQHRSAPNHSQVSKSGCLRVCSYLIPKSDVKACVTGRKNWQRSWITTALCNNISATGAQKNTCSNQDTGLVWLSSSKFDTVVTRSVAEVGRDETGWGGQVQGVAKWIFSNKKDCRSSKKL